MTFSEYLASSFDQSLIAAIRRHYLALLLGRSLSRCRFTLSTRNCRGCMSARLRCGWTARTRNRYRWKRTNRAVANLLLGGLPEIKEKKRLHPDFSPYELYGTRRLPSRREVPPPNGYIASKWTHKDTRRCTVDQSTNAGSLAWQTIQASTGASFVVAPPRPSDQDGPEWAVCSRGILRELPRPRCCFSLPGGNRCFAVCGNGVTDWNGGRSRYFVIRLHRNGRVAPKWEPTTLNRTPASCSPKLRGWRQTMSRRRFI